MLIEAGKSSLDYFEYVEFNSDAQFFCFRPEIPFLGKLAPESQKGLFKIKFCIWTNLNKQNLIAMFTFSVFDWKYPFWANLVPKSKLFF